MNPTTDIDELLKRALKSASKDPQSKMDTARDRVMMRILTQADEIHANDGFEDKTQVGGSRIWFTGWRRFALVAAGLLLAIAVGGTWLQRSTPALLSVGATVTTRDEAVAMMMTDGSRIEIRAASELSLESTSDGLLIRLSRGGIIIDAAKQASGHLYVRTKDALISVVGTVFLVNAEEEGSRVAVLRGEVHVKQGPEEKKLNPGEQVVTNSALEPRPVREELLWSHEAEARIAEWEQSAIRLSAEFAEGRTVGPQEAFSVVSVKPLPPANGGRGSVPLTGCSGLPPQIDPQMLTMTANLYTFIAGSYGQSGCLYVAALDLLSGGPVWVRSDQYEIRATMPEGFPSYTPRQLLNGDAPRVQAMLRKVLEERFKLVLRREQKEMKALLLKVTNNKKPVLTRSEETDKMFSGSRVQIDPGGRTYMKIEGGKATMATLARTLTFAMRRPVLDRTGITGEFNFVIEYDDDGIVRPILPDALRERTGLELQDTKALVETWVIERAERPSEN